jgi:hypothetical protein
MADYYPLIARAVTGLDKSTGEARRALYERARTALVTQLRGVEPALSEADITRERLALEEAIRKVEAEAARRPRQEFSESARAMPPLPRFDMTSAPPPAPSGPPEPSPPPIAPSPPPPPEAGFADAPPPPEWEELRRDLDDLAAPQESADSHAPQESAESQEAEPLGADEPPLPFEPEPEAPPEFVPPAAAPPAEAAQDLSGLPRHADKRFSNERSSLVDQGLRGFRDVIAETEDLGGASASASRSARETREAFSALPHSGEIQRIEPRVDPRFGPEDLMRSEDEIPPAPPARSEFRGAGRPIASRPRPDEFDEPEERPLRSGLGRGLRRAAALAVILLLLVGAFFAYREWGSSVIAMFQSARAPATQTAKESPQTRPKISDRIGGAQQDTARPAPNAGAAVAQRAVLYEQQANPQERKQYVGSVIWRTEKTAPGPGQPPDVAVKAEVEIPERHMRMSFTVRRNLDQSLPASHTVEILFSTPADFEPGGIADVPGVLMEDNEQTRGAPLSGLRVKVTNGFFLVGLSSAVEDLQRNVQLLKGRPWLHIRIEYSNGQRALLAIEKGVPGDRAFQDALTAWGQNPPEQR